MKILTIRCNKSLEAALKSSLAPSNILVYDSVEVSETNSEFTYVVDKEPGKEFDDFLSMNFTNTEAMKFKVDLRVRYENLRTFTDDAMHGKKHPLLKLFHWFA